MISTPRTHPSLEEARVTRTAIALPFVDFLGRSHSATTTMAFRIAGCFRGDHLYESFSAGAPRIATRFPRHARSTYYCAGTTDGESALLTLLKVPSKSAVPIFSVMVGTIAEEKPHLQRVKSALVLPALSPKRPRAAQTVRYSSCIRTAVQESSAAAYQLLAAPSNCRNALHWQWDNGGRPGSWRP